MAEAGQQKVAPDQSSKDVALLSAAYLRFLRVVRRIRRISRQLFRGKVPDWLGDFTGILGRVNLIGALPTILAVLLVPRHFFSRISEQPKTRIPMSLSPTKLLMHCAGITGILVLLVGYHMNERLIVLYVVLIAIFSPIWIPALVSITAFIACLLRTDLVGGENLLVITLRQTAGSALPLEGALTSLRTLQMNHLSERKFMWGSCYLSVAILVAGAVLACLLVGMTYLSSYSAHGFNESGWLLWPTILTFSTLAIIFLNLVVNSYQAMLDSVAVYPSKAYYRRFRKLIKRRCQEYYFQLSKEETRSAILSILKDILDDAILCEQRICSDKSLMNRYLKSRETGLRWVDDLTIYFENLDHLAYCRSFIALKSPLPIADSLALPAAFVNNDSRFGAL